MQALEKELANFGKEKDKHIRNAQAKAKKAKADTEVRLHRPVEKDFPRPYAPFLEKRHASAEGMLKSSLRIYSQRGHTSYMWTRRKGEIIHSDELTCAGCCCLPDRGLSWCRLTAQICIPS